MGLIEKIADAVARPFRTDAVYALVGKSGTGKSYNAKMVAARFKLQAIIDDGLLIVGDSIVAGRTAKSEKSYLSAVRAALFDDKARRDETVKCIRRFHIRRILIIGTSVKMVMKIADRLQLNPPSRIIHIEEISSKEQIALARRSREIEGKHVIPVASLEVKKRYPGIFSGGIRFTFHRSNLGIIEQPKDSSIVEKSIVQPEFSRPERVDVSQALMARVLMDCVSVGDSDVTVKKMSVATDDSGCKIFITVDIPPSIDGSMPLAKRAESLQKSIIGGIENVTGVFVKEVNLLVDRAV